MYTSKSSIWKMPVALGKHYTGKRGRPEDYMERYNSEEYQPDECDVRWNLPNSNEQTGLESTDHPMC